MPKTLCRSILCQPIAEKALEIDGVCAQPLAQALPELADMALNYVFVDAVIEEAIDEIEDSDFVTRRPLLAIRYSRIRRSRLGRGNGSPSISGSRPSENTLILPASGCSSSC